MTKLETLEQEISKLSSQEWTELRNWVLERDASEWDRQVENDAASGRLDSLFEEALVEHHAGKSREL